MISENCSIDEFVETVKGKEPWEVITLAVEEATWAERLFYRSTRQADGYMTCGQQYSYDLKKLIDYLRYVVTPRRPQDRAYCLYIEHWGHPERQHRREPLTDHLSSIH
jgi:hypothetical protein